MKTRCEDVERDLALFVYEELPAGEMGRMGIHIGGCERCRSVWQETRGVLSLADRYEVLQPPVDVAAVVARAGPPASPRWGRSLALAAAAAVLLALVPALILLARRGGARTERDEVEEPGHPAPRIAAPAETPKEVAREPALAEVPAPQPPKKPGVPGARLLLAISCIGGGERDPWEVRRRLAATGVEVEPFLSLAVLEEPAPSARVALSVLEKTAPGAAVPAAGAALRARADLAGAALALLATTSDPRAVSFLERAWGTAPDAEVARALAARRSSSAARALAARLRTARGPGEPASPAAVWEALLSMGDLAAEPVARMLPELDREKIAAAIDAMALARTPVTAAALRSLAEDPEHGIRAVAVLARWGDLGALDPLLVSNDPGAVPALEALAAASPILFARRLRDATDTAEPAFARAARALGVAAPLAVRELVLDLARTGSRRDHAIAVAREARIPEAALALLTLGMDRARASAAVDAAALLGVDGAGVLLAFLSTRYGAQPAAEALARLTGRDFGTNRTRWIAYFRSAPPSN
ncbi:MAG: hypothetical protein HY720_24295 [Planctomycetes bacterium]|nr:hypothetical protein [Planctomycetota bacterium]